MKIAFITSCLEPGRDGVGDYTKLLAGECLRLGHEVRLIALNDPYVRASHESADALRLWAGTAWKERTERAAGFLQTFAPDFVSVQFVAYGFHPRGMDPVLAFRLRAIAGSRPVHIMFHELWIGAEKGAHWKDRIIGKIQRSCLLCMVRSLDARVVHANATVYAALLRARGVAASTLPLFGSIPLPPPEMAARMRDGTLVFGMFGALHPVWPPEPLFSSLRSLGKKIVIAHVGRLGVTGEPLWKKLTEDYAGVIEYMRLGEQAPEKIATFFRTQVDIGIATTPWELIGKSATVASMLEHGLPVIVNRDDWHADVTMDTGPVSPLLIKLDNTLLEKISSSVRREPVSLLPAVTTQFLRDLEMAL